MLNLANISNLSLKKRINKSIVMIKIQKFYRAGKKIYSRLGKKEVLLKAVAQATLVCTMSCFKFPKEICEDTNRMCARF